MQSLPKPLTKRLLCRRKALIDMRSKNHSQYLRCPEKLFYNTICIMQNPDQPRRPYEISSLESSGGSRESAVNSFCHRGNWRGRSRKGQSSNSRRMKVLSRDFGELVKLSELQTTYTYRGASVIPV